MQQPANSLKLANEFEILEPTEKMPDPPSKKKIDIATHVKNLGSTIQKWN